MLTTLATLAALALMQQTDTTVPVRAGARLEISNFGGEIADMLGIVAGTSKSQLHHARMALRRHLER